MFKKLLLVFGLLFSLTTVFSQTTISVPFSDGFIGTYTGSNSSPVAYHLSYVGIHNVRFTQNSSTGLFVGAVQGNDIPGNLILRDNNNVQYTIPGVINWRAPSGTVTTMVFLPADGTNVTIATNGANGSSSYTIKGSPASPYTAIGLTFNGSTLSFTEGGPVTGNAATSGLLSALNSYLTSLPSLTINSVNVTEGGVVSAIITVTLSAASANTITVDYTTGDNTALSGVNYTGGSGTLTFAPGQTTKTISIPIIDNQTADNGKTFYVNLSNPTNASVIGLTGTVTIIDTDVSLGTTDVNAKFSFALKQNPVKNGVAIVEYHNSPNATVSVFDATGKKVKNIKLASSNGTESIDVSGLSKGVYMLLLTSQNQAAVTKMLIQ